MERSKGKLAHLEQLLNPIPLHVTPQARVLENSKAYDMIQELKTMFANKKMDNHMGKSVELHAMLKHYEKGIPKKAETPAVLAIREGKIQKDRKNRKGQRVRTRSLEEELLVLQGLRESKKLKHGALSLYVGNGMCAAVEAIGSFDLILPSGLIIVLGKCHFAPSITKGVVSISYLDNNGYPKEKMGYYFYIPLENKIFVAQNAEFFENNLMVQEASGSHGHLESSGSDEALELIQEEDTQPSENTSKEHNEVVPIVVEPQNVEVPIRRSARIPQAPDRYGFYVDVEEYELGDLDEPPNYKAALSDPESDK
ncbi:hypothetical protein Tco_0743662 [Tanacetum coccineum]